MPRSRPRVVVTRRLPGPVEARMTALFEARLAEDDAPMDKAALITAAENADVLVPTIGDAIDADVIRAGAAQGLSLIANFGAGVDHIDLAAAHAAGVVVCNTPGVLTEDTADMAMALILAAPRRLIEGARIMAEDRFPGWSPTWMLGRSLTGKALAVVGMGRIGQAVARRARACGMAIHYHNRHPVSPVIATALDATYWADLDAMLEQADVVSVNCPSTPATYHLLSRPRLERLPTEAFVVNTARGEIIDETALADLLEAGRIAGAALDVFEREPAVDPRLARMANVVLMPHMSSSTLEARVAMGELAVINIRVWQDGERPPNRVFPNAVFDELL